ncbi:MAG: hypothetical protein ACXVB1_14835, partial [Pseudobdellovibrionaceae bacterium]
MFSDRKAWEAAVGGFFAPVDVAGQLSVGQTLAAGSPLILPFAETATFTSVSGLPTALTAVQVPNGGWSTWSGGKTP